MTARLLGILVLAHALSAPISHAAQFEGTVSAELTRAGQKSEFLFTRKGAQLRLESGDASKHEPINIVDLEARKLTIIYPHNSSFAQIDLTKPPAQPGAHPLQLNIPGSQTGPPPRPGFLTPSRITNSPMGAAMPVSVPELKKTDQTKIIQGFNCTLYTISSRMETCEIWATSDSALFPFRLPERNVSNRHFGPLMLEGQWVDLLRKESLFPLEAALKMESNGQERLTFKINKIDRKKIDDGALFNVPENFYKIDDRSF